VSLDGVRQDWTRLGADDPLWAVYVAPGTRGGKWDLEEFLGTGRREVDAALAEARALGLRAGGGRALDFGCGVGRLSNALAAHVDEVVAVDIADTMLTEARRLDRSGGKIRFVLNTTPDLGFLADGSVDLVYSSLVLQHLPPGYARRYLAEFARVLAPGGTAVVQTVTGRTRSPKGLAAALLPWPAQSWLQRRLLGYPAGMRMRAVPAREVEAAFQGTGVRVVAAVDDPSYGGHWRCVRFFAGRGEQGRREQGDGERGQRQ
jgi:SAM-dependent methyltransferase